MEYHFSVQRFLQVDIARLPKDVASFPLSVLRRVYKNLKPCLLELCYSIKSNNHYIDYIHTHTHMYIYIYIVYTCCILRCLVRIVVFVLCVLLSSYVYLLYYVCIAVFTLDAGLMARSQYSEGPETDHFDTGFSWFPCVYKQMLTDGSQDSKLPLHASNIALQT